jgi:integrase
MRLKLTEKTIAARCHAPDPSGKQQPYWDKELKGFGVLCSGITNVRSYIVQRDMPNGKTRRVTIGAVAEIPLAEARKRAADVLDDLRRGKDPKQRSPGGRTLRQAFDGYLDARKTLRPASRKVYAANFKNLADWHDLPIRSITGEMVEKRHRVIAAEIEARGCNGGQYTANATMRLLRTLYAWVADREADMAANPVRLLKGGWYEEKRRMRMVTDAQMPSFYRAVCGLDSPVVRDFVLMMLFTGMRLTETKTLQWTDVDLTNRSLTVPADRTKGKRDLVLPLTDFVRDLLVARRALGDAKWVFPGNSRDGHIGDPNPWLAQCGFRISAHDLRRTYSTIAERCEISHLALKALLNHSTKGDVTAGYVQLELKRLRAPAQKVADEIKALCGIEEIAGGNVTRMAAGD